jgi:hypothetical protein
MKFNVNHPSVISFLEKTTKEILSSVSVINYFKLTQEKKLTVLYSVFKLLKKTISLKLNVTDLEMKTFISVLCKINEQNENYEFAAMMNDIVKNYETIKEFTNPVKKIKYIKKESNKNV